MRRLRMYSLSGLFVLCVLLLVACGTSSTYSSSGSAAPAPTKASSNEAKEYATPAATKDASKEAGEYATPAANKSTTGASASGAAVIKTAQATVKGKAETILTNAQGMTLYYFTPDTKTTTACSTGCISNWPPLLAPGSSTPASATPLTGKLSTQQNTNGMQVQYNGHFLYTFAGDSAAGQTNGQGIGGKWYAATPDLA